jgi:hypothetical protein
MPNYYYLANRSHIIEQSKQSYRQKIGSLSTEELLEYRKEKSRYFKSWYLNKKLKEGWTPKPPKTVAPKTEQAAKPDDVTFDFTFNFKD